MPPGHDGRVGYDAVLLVSFGGPEGPDDVDAVPAQRRSGRGVPDERLRRGGGALPAFRRRVADQRAVPGAAGAVAPELDAAGIDLPLYWGNRNWHPYLADTAGRDARRRRPAGARLRDQPVWVVLVVPAVPRRHRAGPGGGRARRAGHRQDPPLPRPPRLRRAVRRCASGRRWPRCATSARRAVVFTAHSIPTTMARQQRPGRRPVRRSAARDGRAGRRRGAPDVPWDLVWQSRSGPPQVPWLEPDINDHLRASPRPGRRWRGGQPDRLHLRPPGGRLGPRHRGGATAASLGWRYRAGGHPRPRPRFVAMVRELIHERARPGRAAGPPRGVPIWDTCPAGCCLPRPTRPKTRCSEARAALPRP